MDGINICENPKAQNNNDDIVYTWQSKIKLLETENKLLKDKLSNKQRLIDIIETNLFKLRVTLSIEKQVITILAKSL